jgi:hypothetical protein
MRLSRTSIADEMREEHRRRLRILDWVRMHRSHDRYNDVEPSSPPQSSPDYTIVIRGYNFREGQGSCVKARADKVATLAFGNSCDWLPAAEKCSRPIQTDHLGIR